MGKFWSESDGTPKVVQEQGELQENLDLQGKDNLIPKSQNHLEAEAVLPKIYSTFEVCFEDELEDLKQQIMSAMKQFDPEFMQGCTHGVELLVKNKPFVRSKQLKKVKNVTDLSIKRIPEPVVVED